MDQQTQTNLLQDIEQDIYLEHASVGTRFLNLLIDVLFFYGVVIVVFAVFGLIFVSTGEDINTSFLVREDPGAIFLQYIVTYSVYIGLYTLLEGAARGKTLGKLITGTRALKADGSNLSWKDAFMRSLCRIVPFEAFSAFGGHPWHDKWTDTIVVKERK